MVTGRLVLSDPSHKVDWAKQVRLSNIGTKVPPLPVPAGLSGDARRQWVAAYWQSPEGKARTQAMRSYPLEVAPDGSFTAEDVAPGAYEVRVQLHDLATDPNNPASGKIIGFGRQDIVVPEGSGDISTQTFEAGSVMVKLNSK